ncbi:Asp-tRNA(Asn)/Glu-tRNA(Gln) amidotransferase subunit GatA [Portibacter lacus]|uniref:Glutamyl-tRNA(Gln) amidotransferase subunit A n=1 Tax=Portibacter lacus TaxID=1099794 RepID=A0AA37SNV7_9BACT|nr:Asp-tRNA(Asn)/Glu-tRNA(Gln) amidotransferase subunit GatA [Portibacter lacus]GLR18151.1 glutamyl-tRNA(Gln) amidotransferase subunit A [Portibacter lacus]
MIAFNLSEIREKISSGELTLAVLTQSYLDQIERTKDLNIYVNVFGEEALQRAADLDKKYAENPESVGKLFGMVVSIKDVICYKDHEVTAASKMLKGFKSLFSSTAVQRLIDEDAIIIGSTNCDEFAMGSSNENSAYGPTKNADNPDYIPGGSSGGAAVSVQAKTCLVALGSDTGGSVRQPAAFCNVIGMKPTYGRISRHGLIAYASSFDQIGLVGHTVEDMALVLEVISGADDYDSTVSQKDVPAYSAAIDSEKKIKIGVIESFFDHPKMNPEIREKSKEMLKALENKGYELVPISFENIDYLVPSYYVLTTAEASTNLSRFDGVKFGHRSQNISDLESLYRFSRTEGFGIEVKRRIMLGAFVLSSGYYDAYFEKAQKIRKIVKDEINGLFSKVDVIALPTSMDYPWKIGDANQDPVSIYLSDVFTVIANLCGIPALSFPLEKGADNVSSGIQLLSNSFEEQHLFNLSACLQNMA